MRAFSTEFSKGLSAGLYTQDREVLNDDSLEECFNLKPTTDGLVEIEEVTQAVCGTTISWPFPQLFLFDTYRILADREAIYTLDDSFSATKVLDVTSGLSWDGVDYGTYVLLTNGSTLAYTSIDTSGVATWASASASTSTIPLSGTVCDYKGQMVVGNITGTWDGVDERSVMFGQIGAATFSMSDYNEVSYAPILSSEVVHRVLPLSNSVIICGDEGVHRAVPRDTVWGINEIIPIGIPCKGAACSSGKDVILVSNKGTLWHVTGDAQKEVGYQSHLTQLTPANIMISYNPLEATFFISDGAKTFVYTGKGMGESQQLITSLGVEDGELYGAASATGDLEARVVTGWQDSKVRGLKTIRNLSLGLVCEENTYVSLDYRYDKTSAEGSSLPWVLTNPEGVGFLGATVKDYRMKVKCSSFSGFALDYILAELQLGDKRFSRSANNATKA